MGGGGRPLLLPFITSYEIKSFKKQIVEGEI